MREMTQPGDPMMRIRLPTALEKFLKDEVKKNGRRHQDETIKRVNAMLKAGAMFKEVQARLIPGLVKIYKA